MGSPSIARVAIVSPLPQLDRLFDYQIPEELESLARVGVRVKVLFGNRKTTLDAFIVEIIEASAFEGKLSKIIEITSVAPVLDPMIYKLCRAIADRQAASLGEVLRLAIADRSIAIEKKWLEDFAPPSSRPVNGNPKRISKLVRPVILQGMPSWVQEITARVIPIVESGRSVIILVPDFRDQALVLAALEKVLMTEQIVDYSSVQSKSKRYASFLRCISNSASVVIGSRSAVYAPVNNLQEIIIWDDGDLNHLEPSSPYSHTRELSLVRQMVQSCNLTFLSHARSTEMQRLISMGFVEDSTEAFPIPKIAHSETDIRVDSLAWQTIRAAVEQGPVLVQVASKGNATSAYCSNCNERATCKSCNGPIWLDSRNQQRCRWCNTSNLDYSCQTCGSATLKQGKPGSGRTASEFGKSFPGVQIIESNYESKVEKVSKPKTLVISTPGAEPFAENGYSAVIILDAKSALAKDSLKATEEAVRQWSNAIALMGAEGRAVLVGVAGTLGTKFSLWSQAEISAHELATRNELRFPPAVRLASIGAEKDTMTKVVERLNQMQNLELLGPISIIDKGIEVEQRVLIKYEYSSGQLLAETLKSEVLKLSAGQQRFNPRSGRAMRPIRVKMDDSEVI
jgi:primosomal protein N' (replication factor Y)